MTDQREVVLVYIGIALQLGGVVAAAYISAALAFTAASLGFLILAIVVVGVGRILVRRAERGPKVFVQPAVYGEPTEPGICPLCKERPGTVRVQNFVAVPASEIPNPRPDVWVCDTCTDRWIYRRMKAPGDVGS